MHFMKVASPDARTRLAYLMAALLTLLLLSLPARAYQAMGERLDTSQYLTSDQYLVSENKNYFAIMQGDGNFMVYRGSGPGANEGWVWSTNTPGGTSFFTMQGDGNLVLYRGGWPGDNRGLVWQSGKQGAGSPQLKLSNNGQIQIVSNDVVYWESPPDRFVANRDACRVSVQGVSSNDIDRGISADYADLSNYTSYKQCLDSKGTTLNFAGYWNDAVRNYCKLFFNTSVMGNIDDYQYLSSCFTNRWVAMPKLYIGEYHDLYASLIHACLLNNGGQPCIDQRKPAFDTALNRDWPGATATYDPATRNLNMRYSSQYPVSAPAVYTTNLALRRPTSQSLMWGAGYAKLAVDGDTSGNYGSGSVTHTSTLSQAWWQVDLDQRRTVTEVTLFNRTDCCKERLGNFHVDLLDGSGGVLATQTYSGNVDKSVTIKFPSAVEASAVRVQLHGANYLSLAEVVVKGNVALGKSASQSTTIYGAGAQKAVDGNTRSAWADNSLTHTDNQSKPWWKVDLQKNRNIGEVVIWNRTDCCSDRLSNFVVELINEAGGVVKSYSLGSASARTVLQFGGASGRWVQVRLNGTNPLSLAEVEVFEAAAVSSITP